MKMKKINIAFFGSPYFSAEFLEMALSDKIIKDAAKIKLVITQPDKPVGRRKALTPTPVAQMAAKHELKVLKTKGLRLNLKNYDLALVFAYAKIIPASLLHQPRYGFLNIHPSLLPRYRGPSPIAYPLIAGDEKTGVTIIHMDERIDHGDIIAQQSLSIPSSDRRPELEHKLTKLAFEMIKKILISVYKGLVLKAYPQIHSQATYTKRLKREYGFISSNALEKALDGKPLNHQELPLLIRDLKLNTKKSSGIIYNYFRGLYPWPGIWTKIKIKGVNRRLKILNLEFKDKNLTIKKVQLEGKKPVDYTTFKKAYGKMWEESS